MKRIDATVVIPVKNGEDCLDRTLTMLDKQKTVYSYEIVCIDSGSSDHTLDIIEKHRSSFPERYIVKQIPKEEFGHGKTRNLGASLGSGEFILFITQDACPYDENWVQNFIDGMKSDPDTAGGFGKHYPYPECDIFEAHSLEEFFKGFGIENTIYQIDSKEYDTNESYRHFVTFYSDNNSCMRRSIWKKIPYPDVDFAEDQLWARTILEKGYKKLYCPGAAVYHSHSYPAKTYKKRFFDEYKSLFRLHGYKLVENRRQMLLAYARTIKNDLVFLNTLKLSLKERIHWLNYAVVKEWHRFHSGYIAGKYFTLNDDKKALLDKKMSQQIEQIKE